jgi:hypothetical protein
MFIHQGKINMAISIIRSNKILFNIKPLYNIYVRCLKALYMALKIDSNNKPETT